MLSISWEVQLRFVPRHTVRYFWLPDRCFEFFASFHLFCRPPVLWWLFTDHQPNAHQDIDTHSPPLWDGMEAPGWAISWEIFTFLTSQPCWTHTPPLPAEVAQGNWGGLTLVHSRFLLLLLIASHSYPTLPQTCSGLHCECLLHLLLCCLLLILFLLWPCSWFFFTVLVPFSFLWKSWGAFLPFLKYDFPEVPAS